MEHRRRVEAGHRRSGRATVREEPLGIHGGSYGNARVRRLRAGREHRDVVFQKGLGLGNVIALVVSSICVANTKSGGSATTSK